MLLEVPFYANVGDGKQCMQVAMQGVLRKFLGKEYSREQLDTLTGRNPNQWTWTVQVVSVLHDLGLHVRYFSKAPLEPLLAGETYLREMFGPAAEKVIPLTNVPGVVKSTKELLTRDLFEQRLLSPEEIEEHLRVGRPLIVLVDHNVIVGRVDYYNGHVLTLTGFDQAHFYYHESGPHNPEANKRISKELFFRAWNAHGTDNDVIVIYGRRA
jgi:hypothetical protein